MNRLFSLICLLSITSNLGLAYPTPEGRVIDVSIDIDDTLYVKEEAGTVKGAKYVTIKWERAGKMIEETYRQIDGAPEFISALREIRIPGVKEVRVHFRSMGFANRNIALLQATPLVGESKGKTAADIALYVRNLFDAEDVSWDPKTTPEFFKGKGRKNLEDQPKNFPKSAVNPDGSLDLSDALMVDDLPKYMKPGQEESLILVNTYPFMGKGAPTEPAARANALGLTRLKLAYAYGLVISSLKKAIKENKGLREVTWAAQFDDSNWPKDITHRQSTRENAKLMQQGLEAFSSLNPKFKKPVPVPGGFEGPAADREKSETNSEINLCQKLFAR